MTDILWRPGMLAWIPTLPMPGSLVILDSVAGWDVLLASTRWNVHRFHKHDDLGIFPACQFRLPDENCAAYLLAY